MARIWDGKIDRNPMEGTIIEIFGCTPFKDQVITLFDGKERITSDFYIEDNIYERSFIEIFGCITLDKIIKLERARERIIPLHDEFEGMRALVVGID